MLFDQQLAILLYIVQASPVTFYRLNFPVTSVSSSRTWLMESGELISHGMFGAPDLRIITICRAGRSWRQIFHGSVSDSRCVVLSGRFLSLFQGIVHCVDALDGSGLGRDGCKLSRSSVNCEL